MCRPVSDKLEESLPELLVAELGRNGPGGSRPARQRMDDGGVDAHGNQAENDDARSGPTLVSAHEGEY